MIGGGPTDDINVSIGAAGEELSINSSKANAKICLIFHYNYDNSYLMDKGKSLGF